MAAKGVDVFIAHAGEQKLEFVDVLRILLKQVHHLDVFVDEHSLAVGDHAREQMKKELAAAAVVVIVLSPEFVRKKHPMGELHTALARQRCPDGPEQQKLCPIFYSLGIEDCSRSDFREQYDLQAWESFGLTEPKPEPGVLDSYAKDIQELCTITGMRQDQAQHYQGILATKAVEAVICCLRAVGRVPEGYSVGMPRCFVPFNRSSLIGREDEVKEVLGGLQKHRCVIISGGPGEGKTALAQQVVWDLTMRRELPGGAHLVNFAGAFQSMMGQGSTDVRRDCMSQRMSQALADLLLSSLNMGEAKALNIQKGGWEAVDELLHVRDARAQRMLILFENAEDTQDTPQAAQELAKTLKRLSGFKSIAVLVTSRTLIACGHAAHIGIGKLDMAPAVKLLQEECTLLAESWEPDLAEQVAELCGRNALCLTIVGSFISAKRCTPQEVVSAARLLDVEREARSGGVSDDEHIASIRGWLLTYLRPQEQEALCRLWMFKGGFELGMAQKMLGSTEPRAVEATLRDLRDTSCLQLSTTPAATSSTARYSMHALVREVFRDEFDKLPEVVKSSILQAFSGQMAAKMDMLVDLQDAGHWPEAIKVLADELLSFQELRSILRSNRSFGAALSLHDLKKLVYLGTTTMGCLGQHAEAATLLHEVTQLASRSLGPRHKHTLWSMDGLACALSENGDHAAAIAQHKQLLQLRREIFGGEDATIVVSMAHLADALQDGGQLTAAAEQYAQALQAVQRLHGRDHIFTASIMENMASCLSRMGRLSEAVELHEEALDITRKMLGPLHLHTITCHQNLAVSWIALGEHGEAAQELEQIVQTSRDVFGEKHPQTLLSMHSLASALLNLGEHARAAALYEETLLLRQEVLGRRHPHTLDSMHGAACAFKVAGRHVEAVRLHERTLRLRQEVLGPEHVDTAGSMHELGAALADDGKHAAAWQWFKQAYHTRQRMLGHEHRDTADSMNDMGAAMCADGKHAAAVQWFEQALQVRQRVLGAREPDTISSMHNLACALHATGDHGAAAQLHAQTLQLRQEELGLEHKDTLLSMGGLARALMSSNNYTAAVQQLEQTLQLQQKILGAKHLDTINTMNDLGALMVSLGRFDAAVEHLKLAMELLEKLQGQESPRWLDAAYNLGIALSSSGDEDGAVRQLRQVVELSKKLLGPEHADTLTSMEALDIALAACGDDAAEARQLEQTQQLEQAAMGCEHFDTLATMSDEGAALVSLGLYNDAAQRFKQVSEDLKQLKGPDDPHTLDAMHNYALAVLLGGNQWEAAQHFQQVAQRRQKIHGAQHAETLSSMLVLANAMGVAGQSAAAGQHEGLPSWMQIR